MSLKASCLPCHVAMTKSAKTVSTPKGKKTKKDPSSAMKLPPGVFQSPFIPAGTYPPRRRLGRRDSEEKVERAIERKFNHLPNDIVNHKMIKGKTLRETLREDYRNKADSKGRLSSKYLQLRM